MKSSMIKPVRIEAGLGNPPVEYTNNDPESANFLIKHGLHFNAQKPHGFIEKIKEIVETQQRNDDRAVYGKGLYRLREEFQHLGVDDYQRSKLTPLQSKKKLASYLNVGMEEKKDVTAELVNAIQNVETTSVSDFETAVRSANILNVPPSIIDGMILKATNLLCTPGNVIPKPGATDESYIVAGTANKVHSVKPGKGGSWTCDRACINSSTKICEHTLAVAQTTGRLNEFLTWFGRTRKRPNMMGMVEQGGPKSAGKKPSSRKRSNVKSPPVNEYVDIFHRDGHEPNETVSQLQNRSQSSLPSMAVFSAPWEPSVIPRTTSNAHIYSNASSSMPPSSSSFRFEIPSHTNSCYASPCSFQAASPTSTSTRPRPYHSVAHQQPPVAAPLRHANTSHFAAPSDSRVCGISQSSSSAPDLHHSTPSHLLSGVLGLNACNTFNLKWVSGTSSSEASPTV